MVKGWCEKDIVDLTNMKQEGETSLRIREKEGTRLEVDYN